MVVVRFPLSGQECRLDSEAILAHADELERWFERMARARRLAHSRRLAAQMLAALAKRPPRVAIRFAVSVEF